jgi:hypothetical protein
MSGPFRFLHIGFYWSGPPKTSELEPIFDQATDWIRYAQNCWIIRTTTDPDTWLARLKPLMAEKDRVFICEMNTSSTNNYSGWLDKWMWERIQTPKT